MTHFLLVEDVIRFYIPVHYFSPGNKLQPPRQLIGYFKGLVLGDGSPLRDNILQVAVGAELEDHYYIVLRQKAIIDSSGE